MAAGVQHHYVVLLERAEEGFHFFEFHADGGGVVVGVFAHFEAGAFKNADVVAPGGVAHVALGLRKPGVDKIGTHAQRAGAAERLDGGDAAFFHGGMVGTEQQVLAGATVGGQAFHGQVAARARALGKGAFNGFHALEHGQAAFAVVINAHAEVYFLAARVLVVFFHQAEDGIAGVELNVPKHGCLPFLSGGTIKWKG